MLSSLVAPAASAAQAPQTGATEEEKAKARKELERKALALLEETLQMAQVLKLPENRAAVRSQSADLLWPRDEKRARALFRDAAADLAAAQAAAANGSGGRAAWVLVQLRQQVVYTAAARDPQLALELLRDSRPASSSAEDGAPSGPLGDPDQELRMEQSITAMAVENDPKAALRLAEETLAKGVTFGVYGLLQRLRQKDPESATKLAGEVVARLRGQTLSRSPEATMVAFSLLTAALSPKSGEVYFEGMPAPVARANEKPKPLVMEDGDLRDLADLVSAAALKESGATGGYGLLMQLRSLLPELEKRVPARAAQLRQRLAEMDRQLDPRMKAWAQLDSITARPPEAIIEEAAKAPAEVRAELIKVAGMKLFEAGDTERARQLFADNLRGDDRESMLSFVDHSEVARAVAKGDTDAAKSVAAHIKSKERRAGALAEVAILFATKGDRKTAAALLEEARGLVERRPESERGVEALLEVARGYALVDPPKTFEMIDPLVEHANDMLTAAALLEKFGQGAGTFRKGEMVIALGLGELGGAYARYVKALGELARVDFDRTRATADHFNRDEVRLLARLVVARSVLSDRPDPATPAPPAGTAPADGSLASH
jgi:hypothetical protein